MTSLFQSPFRLTVIITFILLQYSQRGEAGETQATCYFPDGSVAAVYTPCSNNTGACCYHIDSAHHDLCYSNGFCYSLYFGYLYRGACTDSAWNTQSGCANECVTYNTNQNGIATHCIDSSGYNYMCCGEAGPSSNCCSDTATFVWNNASVINFQQSQAGSTSTIASASVSRSTAGGSTSASNMPAATSGIPEYKNNDIALEAGLGVPLGIFVLLTLFFGAAFFRTRAWARRANMQASLVSQGDAHHPQWVQHQQIGQSASNKVELSAEHQVNVPFELPSVGRTGDTNRVN